MTDERTRTMTRLRSDSSQPVPEPQAVSSPHAIDLEAREPDDMEDLPPRSAAEALRKPYASLAPQRPSTTSDTAPRPGTPSLTPAARRVDKESKRWADNTEARRRAGTCAKHGIARSPTGECMLCKKEEAAAARRSPMPFVIGGLVVVGALGLVWSFLF